MAKTVNAAINTSLIVELSSLKLMKLKIKFDIDYSPFFTILLDASRLASLHIAYKRMQSS